MTTDTTETYEFPVEKGAARQPYELVKSIHNLLDVLYQSTAMAGAMGLINAKQCVDVLEEVEDIQDNLTSAAGPPARQLGRFSPDDDPEEIPPLLALFWQADDD